MAAVIHDMGGANTGVPIGGGFEPPTSGWSCLSSVDTFKLWSEGPKESSLRMQRRLPGRFRRLTGTVCAGLLSR